MHGTRLFIQYVCLIYRTCAMYHVCVLNVSICLPTPHVLLHYIRCTYSQPSIVLCSRIHVCTSIPASCEPCPMCIEIHLPLPHTPIHIRLLPILPCMIVHLFVTITACMRGIRLCNLPQSSIFINRTYTIHPCITLPHACTPSTHCPALPTDAVIHLHHPRATSPSSHACAFTSELQLCLGKAQRRTKQVLVLLST